MVTRTRIKICGVRDVETARAAAEAGADAIGLVFVEASPRCVSAADAARIAASLPAFVEAIGLFVDAAPDAIRRTAAQVGLSAVQLHGRETPSDARALAPLRVIRAMPFTEASLAAAGEWATLANLAGILWDAPPPAGAATTGGTGHTFDWTGLAHNAARDRTPMILAGGLTPENVMEAIRVVRPWAVDVSSGVESSRGVKDHARIAAFCQAVRDADAIIAADV